MGPTLMQTITVSSNYVYNEELMTEILSFFIVVINGVGLMRLLRIMFYMNN